MWQEKGQGQKRHSKQAVSYGSIAVYGYLLHIENRQTYKCYASYKTIGKAVKMSTNTVRKYVQELETRHLIRTETSSIVAKDVSAPVIKCKKTPRKKCSFVAEVKGKR